MKLRNLFLAVLAGAAALVACDETEDDFGAAKISVEPLELSFTQEGGTQEVALVATRDWMVSPGTLPDWIALSTSEGAASTKLQTVSVSVEKNDGNNRSADVVFTIGFARATLTVNQEGAAGEIKLGSGTLEDPYTVAGVIAYTESLGADVQSEGKVFFKGVISEVVTTYQASGNYGNATFYIVDETGSSDRFYVYQTYYLGNRQWKSGDTDVKEGDEVIVYGPVVNYKGNTPETAGKGASFVYSLNGVTDGGVASDGSTKGSGTIEDPYNPAGAAAYAKSLGSDVQSDKSVYIKGKITKVSTTFEASGSYGNANFYIADATDGTGEFYIYQTYYLGNRKWTSGDTDVKEGDEVIVYGPVVNYKGNTPETVGKGASYIYSLNGVTDGGGQPQTNDETPTGNGTLDSPYNPKAAYDVAAALESGAKSGDVYIKGKISSIKYTFSAQYGTANFNISEDGTTSGTQLIIYGVYYLGNRAWVDGDTQVAVGDEVIICGKLTNYGGTTPETSNKEAYIYSLNGVTDGEQADSFGVEKTAISVAASATSASVKVTGNVAWTASSSDAGISPESGEGAGEITVTFRANEDTENAKTYTVVVSTTAEVSTKSYTVTITQAKASAGGEGNKITIDLTNATTFTETSDDTYKAGFIAEVEGFKVGTYQYKSTSKPIAPDSYSIRIYKSAIFYIEAPGGHTITSLTFKANDYNNGQYCLNLTEVETGSGTATADKDTMTIGPWTGNSSVVCLQAAEGQVRLVSVEVEYE